MSGFSADFESQLVSLGWGAPWAAAFEHHSADCLPARVSRVDRGEFELITSHGVVRATPGTGVAAQSPSGVAEVTIGDWVAWRFRDARLPTVEAVLPRRTAITRLSVGGTSREQVLAANADIVAVVEPLDPEPDLGRIERLLVLAWSSGATPVVVLTKVDLVRHFEVLAEEVRTAAPGVDVIVASAVTGAGVDELQDRLGGSGVRTVALLGASGAGKSSLVNEIVGSDVLRVDRLRGDGKGRHTSVRRELIVIPGGGVIIDTPGLRSVGLTADEEALATTFQEIEELSQECRFRDCCHQAEPGCAVLAAVAAGELAESRLARWRKLQREVAWQEARADARVRAELRNEWKRRSREWRRAGLHRP